MRQIINSNAAQGLNLWRSDLATEIIGLLFAILCCLLVILG